ncbi:hypothetical protein K469DRAFT_716665 [Zopfia rhizophila CBS 207.26]|uniref:Heterokaryon incompatibility domain-containing protein n=1 Tax=Zopfia rhizophila CBS 207.26 TaxID=1314779 RepID=A0A6A6EQI7_9PEZI|nr:hypothetical protein K469DRAFT_716665 [Zopfia rhizophila CBS 207.26]
MSVTKNLSSALRAMRLQNEGWVLWVDATCIDQSNLIEKGFQVPLMTLVYRNCTCTKKLAWRER